MFALLRNRNGVGVRYTNCLSLETCPIRSRGCKVLLATAGHAYSSRSTRVRLPLSRSCRGNTIVDCLANGSHVDLRLLKRCNSKEPTTWRLQASYSPQSPRGSFTFVIIQT